MDDRTHQQEVHGRSGRLVWIAGVVVVAAATIGFGAVIGLAPVASIAVAALFAVVAVALAVWRPGRRGSVRRATEAVPYLAAAGIVTLGLIQLVPAGRDHSNPAVTGEPAWSSPRTRELMVNACYGCHSNEVEWPWYSNVAPISWAVGEHVEEGREAVNYSEFATNPGEADDTIEVLLDGEMPPGYYTRFGLHPEADLTDAELTELIAGLRTTPGLGEGDEGAPGGGETSEQDDED